MTKDLQPQIVKLARRIQALPEGMHTVNIMKGKGSLIWSIISTKLEEAGGKPMEAESQSFGAAI